MKLLIMQFPPPAVTSFLRDPNISLSNLLMDTISLCFSHNARNQFYSYIKQWEKL